MVDRIALVVEYGMFKVKDHSGGVVRVVAESYDLQDCLRQAEISLGHPLVLPISGPTTDL